MLPLKAINLFFKYEAKIFRVELYQQQHNLFRFCLARFGLVLFIYLYFSNKGVVIYIYILFLTRVKMVIRV